MRADPTHGTTECWWVTLTCVVYGLPSILFLLDLGGLKRGQKKAFFGGQKSPILARGHMGKTAVFNQIVLYLETPNLDQKRPSGAKLTPSRKGAPGISFVDAKLMTLATRPLNTHAV